MKNLYRLFGSILVSMLLLIVTISQTGQAAIQASSTANGTIYETLAQKAAQNGSVRVIVSLNTPFEPEGAIANPNAVSNQRAAIQNVQASLLKRLEHQQISSVKKYQYHPALALSVSPEALTVLKTAPEVRTIHEDKLSKPTLGESVSLIGARPDQAYGFTGLGWTVAILDTGVDKTHTMLANKVISEACYSSNDPSTSSSSVCPGGVEQSTASGSGINCSVNSSCNHGTHVAGIASGKGTSTFGTARDANIISIQVFSRFDSSIYCGGTTPCVLSWDSDQLLGLERVYQLAGTYNIAAVNMSLGGGYYTSTQACDSATPYTKTAIDNLRSVQIATVVSSGNEGYTNGLSSPGCISSAISVGSTKDGSNGATPVDTVSSFSNSATFLSLLAPGEWIYSSVPGNAYQIYSGTSMAAPHVAGAFALLKSSKPEATVDQMYTALVNTGKLVTDTRNNITKPRILVSGAINQLGTDLPSITSFSPTSATIGKTVVINGVNFTGATSVKFNDAEADFKVNSSTQINTIVPNDAKTGYIYVTTPNGTARSLVTFTVLSTDMIYTPINADLIGLENSSAAWGDYDQDGDLDILLTGLKGSTPVSKVYRNDSLNVFTDILANLPGIYKGTAIWEDYDRDGDLDILLSGRGQTSAITDIYQNDGNGNFSAVNAGLTPLSDSASAWGDYDNDGDLDLLTLGLNGVSPTTILYRNDQGTLTSVPTDFPGLYRGSVDWGDYDTDNNLDILLTGFDGSTAYTKVYKNNGDQTFTELNYSFAGVFGGTAKWGDYDSDNDLDVLLTGKTISGSFTTINRNMGASGFSISYTDYPDYDESSGAWVDFDNDGDLDFSVMGGSGSPAFALYRNLSMPAVTHNIIGMHGGTMAWGDYDQDQDLDLLITGTTSTGPATLLYRNETMNKNTPPAAPTNLTTAVQTGGSAILTWTAPLDTQTVPGGLSYNLRVGTTPGGIDVVAPDSSLISGYRRLPSFGNAWKGTTATLKNLPPRVYYWSVQAIDSALVGSPFSQEGTFTLLTEARFDKKTVSVREEDSSITVNINLLFPVQEEVQVSYTTVNETALAGNDYLPSSGQLIFAPGQTTQPIQIEIFEDGMSEADETFSITLSNPSVNARLGDPVQLKVSILDNDGFADAGISLMRIIADKYEGITRAWGDYDNDGDLDLVSLGREDLHYTGSTFTYIHKNNGDGTFTKLSSSGLTLAVEGGYLEWGDYDNDGDLDILLLGTNPSSWTGMALIYRNNGNDTFTDINAGLVGSSSASGAWGDYDNDGDLDVVINGHLGNGGGPSTRLYRNNGNSSFTDMVLPLRNLTKGQLAWGDYDNDHDLDLLMTGADSSGLSSRPVTSLLRNNGNGTFTEFNPGLVNVAFGSAAWGDYDGDGDLDILLTGCTDGSCTSPTSRVYRNDGNATFTNINASLPASYWKSYSSSSDADRRLSSWGDYDNDGDLDILLSGIRTAPFTRVYRNDGGNLFTDTQDNIAEGASGPTAWGDYDNDGDLDLVTVTGRIYRNKMLSHNVAPAAPTGLSASLNSSGVSLSWNASQDDQTPSPSLTYNLIVGTYPRGENILSPMANKENGYRRIPAMGNGQHGTSASLKNLLAGTTYYWSVQAVDTAFAGSPFSAEGTFTTPPPTLTLASSTVDVSEFLSIITIQVSLSASSNKPISVMYQTTNGTAAPDDDYVPVSGKLTFNPGQTVRTINITLVQDKLDEDDETFLFTLSEPVNATISPHGSTLVTIKDDDGVPTIGYALSTFSAVENQGSVEIGIILNHMSGKIVTVQVATGTGTATADADFTPVNQVVTFNPGETSKTVSIPLLDDDIEESDETVNLVMSNAVNAGVFITKSVLTIRDHEQPPMVAFSQPVFTNAENLGPATVTVTLSRSALSVVTVRYQTSDGTAISNKDYLPASGTLTFQPGQTSKTFTVPFLADDLEEADETVQLTLTDPTNAVLGSQASAILTIQPVVLPPLTINLGTSGVNIDENQGPVTIQVFLSAPSTKPVTVNYQTNSGTAKAGNDYVLTSGTLTFSAGQTVKTISVNLVDDNVGETDETFQVALSEPTNAVIGTPGAVVVKILDNDSFPVVSFQKSAYSAVENQGSVEIGIILSKPFDKVTTVHFDTGIGSATPGQDYLLVNQFVTFSPGETIKTVTISLLDDQTVESDETISLTLSSAVNALLGLSKVALTIHDYESPLTVQFSQSDYVVSEGQGSASVTVTLSEATSLVVTTRFTTQSNTAVAGEDFEAINTIVTFQPGETSKTIQVPVLNDNIEEPDEKILLTLSEPTNAILNVKPSAVIVIRSTQLKYLIYLPILSR